MKAKVNITISYSILSTWIDPEANMCIERAIGYEEDPRENPLAEPLIRCESREIEVDIPEFMVEKLMSGYGGEVTFLEIKASGIRDVTKEERSLKICPKCGENDWIGVGVWMPFINPYFENRRELIKGVWFSCVRCNSIANTEGALLPPGVEVRS